MKIKRNKLFYFSLCFMLIVSTSLIGCGKKADPKQKQTNTSSKQPTVVRTTISAEPDNLDPYLSAAADTKTIMNNVFEGLMGFDAAGECIPRLAKSVEISDDGLTYTFILKPNITFHNGKLLTIEDIIYSYEKLSGLNEGKPLSSKFDNLTAIHKIDNETVQFVLSKPSSAFLVACTEPVVPLDYTNQGIKPVGTGPFCFDEYTPGQKVVLTANTNYYDSSHRAKINAIEFHIMTDPSSILMALKSGDLDIAQVDSINAPLLKDQFTIHSSAQNMVQLLAMNNSKAPFDNKKVRQAINYAIDKDMIIEGAVNGYGTKLYTALSPMMSFWCNDLSQTPPYTYDITKAKALLKEAGYPNGFSMTLKVPSNYPIHVDTAQMIQQQLKPLGITVNISLVEWAQWLETVYKNGDYEATVVALSGKLDPHDILIRYESTYSKNFYHFSNKTYDELLAKALIEVDTGKRKVLYDEAQKLLASEAVAVYIMDPHLIMASVPNLKGYTPYPVSFFDASTLYYETVQ